MQLSAANLLIASQQIARGAAKPSSEAQAQFTAALAKEKGAAVADFEPMEFRPASAPAKPASAAPTQAPSAGYNAGARLGATLDIRV